MGLSWTKEHVAAMVATLDAEHEDMDSAASAALNTALAIIEERGKFAVVGQVKHTPEHGDIPPSHEAAVKVCLGLFESDTKANNAAATLTNNKSGDLLNTWVVPTFFGTPAAWAKDRRDYYVGLEAKADDKRRDKMRASIAKHEADMIARAKEIPEREAAAGGQAWPCTAAIRKRNECRHAPPC